MLEFTREEIEGMSSDERAKYDAQVPSRIARFSEITPNWSLSPNCKLPGHDRGNLVYVGGGYFDGRVGGPVVEGESYTLAILVCDPGKGAPLHAHTTEEMFMALSGKWMVYWGDDAQHSVILEQWDAVSLPAPVMRGYRNVGIDNACLLTVIGGGNPPRPIDHPGVVEQLKAIGAI